jgi:hypothetical protein
MLSKQQGLLHQPLQPELRKTLSISLRFKKGGARKDLGSAPKTSTKRRAAYHFYLKLLKCL